MSMIKTIADLRRQLQGRRHSAPKVSVGLVATMGALHRGHAQLIKTAKSQCAIVVVTIFVNPLQFNNADDLAKYPNTLEEDLSLCRSLGVDFVFVPDVSEIYPKTVNCTVKVETIDRYLCGAGRPGHFDGVATVVLKLFMIVQPDRAYFGEKDIQQLVIIRAMVRDFNIPVEIVGVPTVREADGLALSSRNARLRADERQSALALFKALNAVKDQIKHGHRNVADILQRAKQMIPNEENLKLEYLDIVDQDDLQLVDPIRGDVIVAGALWVGSVRLIDNSYCNVQ